MRTAIAACAFLLMLGRVSQGAFTDFSDYTQSQTFQSGESFQSNGISFKATEFQAVAAQAKILVSATDSVLLPGQGVEILLPAGIQEVSMRYEDGAASSILVNGVQPVYPPGRPAGFAFLDGSNIAGVQVGTVLTQGAFDFEAGTLSLRGPLTSLVIAGLELSVDDVLVRVPEPSASVVILFTVVAAAIAGRRTRLP